MAEFKIKSEIVQKLIGVTVDTDDLPVVWNNLLKTAHVPKQIIGFDYVKMLTQFNTKLSDGKINFVASQQLTKQLVNNGPILDVHIHGTKKLKKEQDDENHLKNVANGSFEHKKKCREDRKYMTHSTQHKFDNISDEDSDVLDE